MVLLETANLTSGIGNGIAMVAIPWLVLDLTGSAAAAGLVAALSTLPALLVIPAVGAAVDRFGRRRVSIVSDIASAVSVIAYPLVGLWLGLDFTWVLILAIIGASLDPGGYTARKSLIVDAARAGGVRLESLNGIHEAIFAVGFTVGPLVGAGLIATVGPVSAFWIPGALFIIAAVSIGFMRVGDAGREAVAEGADDVTGVRGLLRGITALWADRALRVLTIAIMVLAGVYLPTESIILPVHFSELGRPEGLGIVIAGLAGGSVIGALSYGWLSSRLRQYSIIRLALIGTGAGIVLMAALPPLPLLAAGGFLLGISWGPMEPLLNTAVQQRIPAQEQGRVFSVQMTSFFVFPPLAMLMVGAASERWGVGAVYPVLAALLIVVGLVTMSLKSIRGLDTRP